MSDKELLEKAAKAAGIDVEWDDEESADLRAVTDGMFLKGKRSPNNSKYWNPLTDDGDAFRLAVKLCMYVEPWIHGDSDCSRVVCREVLIDEPHYGGDINAATRRSIVRAAASIGGEHE